ncbi:uncharacterized protein G2W53_044278 [Senna tora]|uniref:Uncharacterized protein n=1 Tax=Senna tora TaxID=362788 RepID=A0A834SK61_9FABA|nr:uncharacterized protein G2W53_044278 [Senna tora]
MSLREQDLADLSNDHYPQPGALLRRV